MITTSTIAPCSSTTANYLMTDSAQKPPIPNTVGECTESSLVILSEQPVCENTDEDEEMSKSEDDEFVQSLNMRSTSESKNWKLRFF